MSIIKHIPRYNEEGHFKEVKVRIPYEVINGM